MQKFHYIQHCSACRRNIRNRRQDSWLLGLCSDCFPWVQARRSQWLQAVMHRRSRHSRGELPLRIGHALRLWIFLLKDMLVSADWLCPLQLQHWMPALCGLIAHYYKFHGRMGHVMGRLRGWSKPIHEFMLGLFNNLRRCELLSLFKFRQLDLQVVQLWLLCQKWWELWYSHSWDNWGNLLCKVSNF